MLTVPIQAIELIGTTTTGAVIEELIETRRLPLMKVLTFGMVNTPISDTPTYDPLRIVAYVTYWEKGMLTSCNVEGDTATLVGMKPAAGIPTVEEALDFYRECYKEQRP